MRIFEPSGKSSSKKSINSSSFAEIQESSDTDSDLKSEKSLSFYSLNQINQNETGEDKE